MFVIRYVLVSHIPYPSLATLITATDRPPDGSYHNTHRTCPSELIEEKQMVRSPWLAGGQARKLGKPEDRTSWGFAATHDYRILSPTSSETL